jgi:hypothetical protein
VSILIGFDFVYIYYFFVATKAFALINLIIIIGTPVGYRQVGQVGGGSSPSLIVWVLLRIILSNYSILFFDSLAGL